MIGKYEFGKMTFSGQLYSKDLIIVGKKVVCDNWWRAAGGHLFAKQDLERFVDRHKPDIIVFGLGHDNLVRFEEGCVEWLESEGISVVFGATGEVVVEFNRMLEVEQKDIIIMGVFHLTC